MAVKIMNASACQHDAQIKLLQEAAIMMQFKHSNVTQLYGIVMEGDSVCVKDFTCVH